MSEIQQPYHTATPLADKMHTWNIMYLYAHMCLCMCMCVYAYIYIYIYIYMRMHKSIHTCVYICMCIRTRTPFHTTTTLHVVCRPYCMYRKHIVILSLVTIKHCRQTYYLLLLLLASANACHASGAGLPVPSRIRKSTLRGPHG